MSYIERNLLPDEQLCFVTKKSLIIFFLPVLLSIFAVYSTVYMYSNPVLSMLAWVPGVVALIFWAYSGLEYATSEYAVTNKRVMMREGFFSRHSNEMRLTAISQVNVDQTLIGQLLNYGTVSLNAFGAFDAYPSIANPFAFQKFVNEQLDRAVK